MKLQRFEIIFDNPQGVFNTGKLVSGKLLLNLTKPMKMRSLKIYFIGQGKSHWTKRDGKATVHYRGYETYINSFITLYGSSSESGRIEHPAGTHEYPFALQLLDNLPSSFEGTRGYVRYFCKACIDRPWKFNSNVKRAFTVIHHLDLNLIPQALNPVNGLMRKDLQGCCCSAGSVTVSLFLNKSGYVPGEPIIYDVTVDNQSDYKVRLVEILLVQTVTYKGKSDRLLSSGNPKLHPKQTSFSLLHQTCNIKQRTSETIEKATVVPSLPPSELQGCDIITIDYAVKVKVSTDEAFSSSLQCAKPIIIGTVPLREPMFQPPPQPSAPYISPTRDQASSPVTSQPESIHLEPKPPSYEEALAPPPSYSECVYGRRTIRDDDDDAHTSGDVSWAPAYPYYDWSTLNVRGQRPVLATAGPPQYDDD